jgi:glyoxalase family protein
MEERIIGLHHITAIAGEAKRNYNFYKNVLGLRFIKKTVNFDDPYTYHFYFGDKVGTPGTILTFFPWEGVQKGRRGTRQVTEIAYSIPENSLDFWMERFEKYNVNYEKVEERFGEQCLSFFDPDGLKIEFVIPKNGDDRQPWETEDITAAHATKGFHSVTIMANKLQPTADVLTNILGYKLLENKVNRYRFMTDATTTANFVDIVEEPGGIIGHVAGGSVHHVAFRVKDDQVLMDYRDKIVAAGLNITEKIDRNYFYSLYFREPGGVLFELATDNPGFAIDESVEELGTGLKLPEQYESSRQEITAHLPVLD